MRGKVVKGFSRCGVIPIDAVFISFFHSSWLCPVFEVSNPEKGADAIICLSGKAYPRTKIDPTLVGRIWSGVIFDGRKIFERQI